mmetsp:Transcript_30312/g.71710  ORF Transcript_30312/g.71710 Transcript_30312/m.71710 type:complete len:234 (+) Transcript_30312:762-1463(+)
MSLGHAVTEVANIRREIKRHQPRRSHEDRLQRLHPITRQLVGAEIEGIQGHAEAQGLAQCRGPHVPDVVACQPEIREVEVVVESWEEARHPHCSNVAVAHVQVCHTRERFKRGAEHGGSCGHDPRPRKVQVRQRGKLLELVAEVDQEREVEPRAHLGDQAGVSNRDRRRVLAPLLLLSRLGGRCERSERGDALAPACVRPHTRCRLRCSVEDGRITRGGPGHQRLRAAPPLVV